MFHALHDSHDDYGTSDDYDDLYDNDCHDHEYYDYDFDVIFLMTFFYDAIC